jgi:hypothetical protein
MSGYSDELNIAEFIAPGMGCGQINVDGVTLNVLSPPEYSPNSGMVVEVYKKPGRVMKVFPAVVDDAMRGWFPYEIWEGPNMVQNGHVGLIDEKFCKLSLKF